MEFLTADEKHAIHLTAELWGRLTKIVGEGPSRKHDLQELMKPIHDIQRAVMAQAAARAYPELYRPLGGERVDPTEAPPGRGS